MLFTSATEFDVDSTASVHVTPLGHLSELTQSNTVFGQSLSSILFFVAFALVFAV